MHKRRMGVALFDGMVLYERSVRSVCARCLYWGCPTDKRGRLLQDLHLLRRPSLQHPKRLAILTVQVYPVEVDVWWFEGVISGLIFFCEDC